MVRRASGLGVLSAARQLAVWGDPIAHSRSPQLHAAAYETLDLDWVYGRRQVTEAGFAGALDELDAHWRGLSVTYPLKAAAHLAARTHDRTATLTGAVNTLLLTADGPHGFNTDVGGIARTLQENGIPQLSRARIIGSGATATSALVALGELGARSVQVHARRPEAVAPLDALGEKLGIRVTAASLTDDVGEDVSVTIAALPGDARIAEDDATALAAGGGMLLDVVYGSWPTPLSQAWSKVGGHAVSGLGMLLHQAVLQIRIFLTGNPDQPLPDEPTVLAAMRRAAVRD